MRKVLIVIELTVALLLIGAIMLQQRGTGLGGAFAGEANVYRSKRGVEKLLFNSTIALAIVLVASVLVHLYLKIKVPA